MFQFGQCRDQIGSEMRTVVFGAIRHVAAIVATIVVLASFSVGSVTRGGR